MFWVSASAKWSGIGTSLRLISVNFSYWHPEAWARISPCSATGSRWDGEGCKSWLNWHWNQWNGCLRSYLDFMLELGTGVQNLQLFGIKWHISSLNLGFCPQLSKHWIHIGRPKVSNRLTTTGVRSSFHLVVSLYRVVASQSALPNTEARGCGNRTGCNIKGILRDASHQRFVI